MKPSSILLASLAVLAGVSRVPSAFAAVNIDYVTVGNVGNVADQTGYGAVFHQYKIGKYEVTNSQYGEFLNSAAKTDSYGLYNFSMVSYGIARIGNSGSYSYSVTEAFANRPVVYVSWFDAARFTNWLGNGQGNGSTETGSYALNGSTSGIYTANLGAQVYIPTSNEWHKAAYYQYYEQQYPDPDLYQNPVYSLYPNQQDEITTTDANYGMAVGHSTDVGSYENARSPYGTFDQGGNVYEWSDGVLGDSTSQLRGGAWNSGGRLVRAGVIVDSGLASFDTPLVQDRSFESDSIGFRVASIPEPSTLIMTLLFSTALITQRRR
jgi:sulfatase modifying factor 1